MTFTYTEDLTVDRDFVRFYTSDTVEAESFLTDEIITSLLAVESTKQKATLAAIRYIIRRLSQPDFRADWLQVSHKTAIDAWRKTLDDLHKEFGISKVTVGQVNPYRVDSDATEEPTF